MHGIMTGKVKFEDEIYKELNAWRDSHVDEYKNLTLLKYQWST